MADWPIPSLTYTWSWWIRAVTSILNVAKAQPGFKYSKKRIPGVSESRKGFGQFSWSVFIERTWNVLTVWILYRCNAKHKSNEIAETTKRFKIIQLKIYERCWETRTKTSSKLAKTGSFKEKLAKIVLRNLPNVKEQKYYFSINFPKFL